MARRASTVKKSTRRRYSSAVTDPRPSILSLSASELEAWLTEHKVPVYRRKQIWSWFGRGATTFETMHDLPKPLRTALESDFRATSLRPIAVSEADRSLTTKTLF